ncbi:MAG: Uncharacterized protein XD94_0385, partial [Mesotoga prima]
MGKSFTGCLCAFILGEKLYRFTTYKGVSIIRLDVSEDRVFIELRQRRFLLRINARKTNGPQLISPVEGRMSGKVDESLSSEIKVELFENEVVLLKGTGENSGLLSLSLNLLKTAKQAKVFLETKNFATTNSVFRERVLLEALPCRVVLSSLMKESSKQEVVIWLSCSN